MEVDFNFLIQSVKSTFKAFKARKPSSSLEPNSYKQALNSPNKEEWLKATYKEFDQLVKFYAFSFIEEKDIPKGKNPITSRMIYKKKPDKFKARLVARGFQ